MLRLKSLFIKKQKEELNTPEVTEGKLLFTDVNGKVIWSIHLTNENYLTFYDEQAKRHAFFLKPKKRN